MDGEYLLTTFGSPVEAELARSLLESHDIPCRIADDILVGVALHMATALGGVKPYVAPSDAPEAARLLEQHFQSLREEPKTETPADQVSRALRTAIVAFLVLPVVMHVWSLVQLLNIPYPTLDARSRNRYWVALSINALVFLVIALVVYGALNSGNP